MAKNTRPLSGPAQRKFFRELFRADGGVSADAADRLTEICGKEIAQVRVRLPLVVRRPAKVTGAAPASSSAASAPSTSAPAAPSIFDPHAFSLIVIFRKGGKDALSAKLDEIGDVEHLRAIAKAQHVAIDGDPTDRASLLSAIIDGTERRIAHRQAAAS